MPLSTGKCSGLGDGFGLLTKDTFDLGPECMKSLGAHKRTG